MPYNEAIDQRVAAIVSTWENTERKKMFGGICHLLNGNMVAGVYKHFLILRLGQEQAAAAMEGPSVKAFDITGRPMKGWVMVAEDGFADDQTLRDWLESAKAFVGTLPHK